MSIYNLDDTDSNCIFPDPEDSEIDGLLAIGGDLTPERLINAYISGIFPWFSEEDPILWWSPNPRFTLIPNELKISKSMASLLKKDFFRVSINQNFKHIISKCGEIKRQNQDGTWITNSMIDAYYQLHTMHLAHSVEVWENDKIVGGLYGILIGEVFFGESMFAEKSNASKYGFIKFVKLLQEIGVTLIDCQSHTPHLESLGAKMIDRKNFLSLLERNEIKKFNLNFTEI